MKKIIITLLLAVTLMLGVTACSSKEEPKPATTPTPEVTKAEVTDAPVDVTEPTTEPTSVEPATTDIEPVDVTPEVTAEPTPTEVPTEWTFTEEDLFGTVEPVTEDYNPNDAVPTPIETYLVSYLFNKEMSDVNEIFGMIDEYAANKTEIENCAKFHGIQYSMLCQPNILTDNKKYMKFYNKFNIENGCENEDTVELNKTTPVSLSFDKYGVGKITVNYNNYSACVITTSAEYPDWSKITDTINENSNTKYSINDILTNAISCEDYFIVNLSGTDYNQTAKITAADIMNYVDLRNASVYPVTSKRSLYIYYYGYCQIDGKWHFNEYETISLMEIGDGIDALYAE